MNVRLVSVDDVLEIISKHVTGGSLQKILVWEITKLNGCLATEEQALSILGEKEIIFEDEDEE